MEFYPLSAALTDPNLSSHVLARTDSHLFPLNSLNRKILHCSFTHDFLSPIITIYMHLLLAFEVSQNREVMSYSPPHSMLKDLVCF